MTTNVDITNRALQLVGTRTTIASMGEASNEAIQASLVYTPIVSWCHAAANWNFARKVASLTQVKTVGTPTTWSNTQPQPPWTFEYSLPSDFVRAIYLTNSAVSGAIYAGEPQRFSLAFDTITAVPQQVLLTNVTPAILVYTGQVAETQWTALFERFVVASLAKTLCITLTGDKVIFKELDELTMMTYSIAEEQNRQEGLVFADTTPEWIQAVGIEYPLRRYATQRQQRQQRQPQQGRQQGNDDSNS